MAEYSERGVALDWAVLDSEALHAAIRSGAASTAADTGIPGWLIQKLGRWRSQCFKLYIPDPKRSIKLAQHSIAFSEV